MINDRVDRLKSDSHVTINMFAIMHHVRALKYNNTRTLADARVVK